ncbi:peptide-methionine (S)-S-oxide reductase [Oleiphilus sp. HI0117]|nr:peptide-methionine (S)-S-oxide reductase [Oleiphilus sp. HI0043]KZZ37942.1 peptide-methionine (S)-S-oxide reductase [Oleiphilus sp. HI0117]KZZ57021.1 peptide-methionine (S)-S-oxide reductase [Oleiphilus sp. HI0123]KZZ68644.1 peptide-methionine (S)-S-oxide reductase [Oleiphilus sp. HI0128]
MPMFFKPEKAKMIKPENALPGRDQAISISATHTVTGNSMLPPFPSGIKQAMFGMGCFWGAERKFWSLAGVYSTAVGYSAGFTPNPSYQEVCSGSTGHNEVVLVAYDPSQVSYLDLLKTFWEAHNPTQGMRQGNDQGTQYRSGIYTFNDEQSKLANESLQQYQVALTARGFSEITTEIKQASEFYYAEEYHQQYLDKNPDGYCGLGGCGVELF